MAFLVTQSEQGGTRKRVLVFLLAYNAERFMVDTMRRIPVAGLAEWDSHLLVIDDGSKDRTVEVAAEFYRTGELGMPTTILRNPVNQGYGGNVKLGMHYAIENGFDAICLIHGDGQYPPEKIPEFVRPLLDGEADAVFGSRMMSGFGALKGGMPLYKFVGNKVLTRLENWLVGTRLSEFHSGLRLYSVHALKRLPFYANANDFHFDTEIIIQLHFAGMRIREFPIPTRYGEEVSHVNGFKYAWDIMKQATLGQMQRLSLVYQRKYDVAPKGRETGYQVPKMTFTQAHAMAVDLVPPNSRVLDVAAADGLVGEELKKKGCFVAGIDRAAPPAERGYDAFAPCDLDAGALPLDPTQYDVVLLLDVLGHLAQPEKFMEALHRRAGRNPNLKLVVSSGNIGFIYNRLQLLFGHFNYGKRGILDASHTRLFTFASLPRLLEEAGFKVEEVRAVPAPFELALGDNAVSRLLVRLDGLLLRLSKGLFGFRILVVASPRPSLETILENAVVHE
ncbi:glycosyl transferase family protein [Paramagnetospirillum caucaseum]|uniref:Glycosyl transferase family protein n=1 Tax=Paramagnetospirillum caucaseum TaxID=1244869 RepID=M2ZP96_9PROT|nr:glycosyl transferase family protein [Paramagnetospirillum caucaseum]